MAREDRKRTWIHGFQTQIALRVAAYLIVFLLVLCNFMFAWRLWLEGPQDLIEQFTRMLRDYLPAILCLLALLPVMAWDTVRFTHRFVGPLVRFRHAMTSISEGTPITPIKLRADDYLTEVRDDFNAMLESLQKRGLPVLKPFEPAVTDRGQREPA